MENTLKCAISNIAWDENDSEEIYGKMSELGFSGIEIAPSKIFGSNPYICMKEAEQYRKRMKDSYGLDICSMQSIWYGRTEQMFRSPEEYKSLLEYTKRAIEFADILGCGNLVFGCPKNRIVPEGFNMDNAIEFFSELGEYAKGHGTVIALEANPDIYGTNFINYTEEAFSLVKSVDSAGFKVNYDFGTVLHNKETLEDLEKNIALVNHVHISRPYLEAVSFAKEQEELLELLISKNYENCVSVEMKQQPKEYVEECLMKFKSVCSGICQ